MSDELSRRGVPAAGASALLSGYLEEMRAGLRGLPAAEIDEILEELRSHILDSAQLRGEPAGPGGFGAAPLPRASIAGEISQAGMAEALQRLGAPRELAALYLTDRLLERAQGSWSPGLLLNGVIRLAARSTAGVFVLLGLLVGYVIATSFFLAAIFKPFAPARVGLWRLPGGELSLRLGFGSPVPGDELLGWWIIPIGLAAAAGGVWIATRLVHEAIRRARRAPLQGRR